MWLPVPSPDVKVGSPRASLLAAQDRQAVLPACWQAEELRGGCASQGTGLLPLGWCAASQGGKSCEVPQFSYTCAVPETVCEF